MTAMGALRAVGDAGRRRFAAMSSEGRARATLATITLGAFCLTSSSRECSIPLPGKRIQFPQYLCRQIRAAPERSASNEELRGDGTAVAALEGITRYWAQPTRHTDVPVLDAANLRGRKGADVLLRTVANAPQHAVLVRNAFTPPEAGLAALIQRSGTRFYAAGTCHDQVASQACQADGTWSRRSGAQMLGEALGPRPTDFHIFHASPQQEGRGFLGMCRGRFDAGTVERLLLDTVLQPPTAREDATARTPRLDPGIGRILGRGNRHIFTAMRPAASVQFHTHGATWFALTHGRKMWWLGPPQMAESLNSVGSSKPFPPACAYLSEPSARLDARVRQVVQQPGDILVFGEGVPHATCALNASLGVGMQMGYSLEAPYLLEHTDWRCSTSAETTVRRWRAWWREGRRVAPFVEPNSSVVGRVAAATSGVPSRRAVGQGQGRVRAASAHGGPGPGCLRLNGMLRKAATRWAARSQGLSA